MKIKFLFAFFLLSFCFNLWADYPWTDEAIYYVPYGKAELINIETYLIEKDERMLIEYKKVSVDRIKGRRELYHYKSDSTIQRIIVVEDNRYGDLISYKEYDGNKKLLWKQTWEYNSKNQMVKRVLCKKGYESCTINLYSYDSVGRLVKREVLLPNPQKSYYEIIEYTNNSKKTSTYHPKYSQLNNCSIEIYNRDGNKVEYIGYDDKGNIDYKSVFKYKGKRVIEKQTNVLLTGRTNKYIYKYMEDDSQKIKLTYKNDKLIEKETKTFDGTRIESVLVEEYEEDVLTKSEFKQYDEIGNIILQRIYSDGQTTETVYDYKYAD